MNNRSRKAIGAGLLAAVLIALAACTSLQMSDPLQVTLAGLEPVPGQGLELRMLARLRVQNPNDVAISYNGVYVQMDVQGKTFATGVSDQTGSVPRFGETVISVPVTVSAMNMARQALGLANGEMPARISYELSGKLKGSTFNVVRFNASGELDLPTMGAAPVNRR